MKHFIFSSDWERYAGSSFLVFRVPATLKDKSALLESYATNLSFPDYFGHNWDAFDECLRDLRWMGNRRVVIAHEALPLEGLPAEQKIYLELLDSAVQEWKRDDPNRLTVLFAPELQPAVEKRMR